MANPHKGEVEFRVGEKVFNLKLTHNSAAVAEEYMPDRTIFDIQGGGVLYVRALLFAMTKGQHGINTIDDAGDLLDDMPAEVTRAVNRAATLFFQKRVSAEKQVATP